MLKELERFVDTMLGGQMLPVGYTLVGEMVAKLRTVLTNAYARCYQRELLANENRTIVEQQAACNDVARRWSPVELAGSVTMMWHTDDNVVKAQGGSYWNNVYAGSLPAAFTFRQLNGDDDAFIKGVAFARHTNTAYVVVEETDTDVDNTHVYRVTLSMTKRFAAALQILMFNGVYSMMLDVGRVRWEVAWGIFKELAYTFAQAEVQVGNGVPPRVYVANVVLNMEDEASPVNDRVRWQVLVQEFDSRAVLMTGVSAALFATDFPGARPFCWQLDAMHLVFVVKEAAASRYRIGMIIRSAHDAAGRNMAW
jgi:hypothetical protein